MKSDKRALVMALLLPPLVIAAFSSMALLSAGSGNQGTPINIAIVSFDALDHTYTLSNGSSYTSTDHDWAITLIETMENHSLTNVNYLYNISEDSYGMLSARELLTNRTIHAILYIPSDFTEGIEYGSNAALEVLADGSNNKLIASYINKLQIVVTEFQQENDITPYFEIIPHEEFESTTSESLGLLSSFTVPLLIFGATLILTIGVICKEGPLSRLLMTPANRSEILISKYITYSLVMCIQMALIFTVNKIIGTDVAGSMVGFVIAMLLVGFYGVTFGIFISTISSNQVQANQFFVGIFLVSLLLSGMFVPVDNMAPILQGVAYCFPLASATPLLNNISLKGLGLFEGQNLMFVGILIAVSCVLIVLTAYFFNRKKFEV